MGEAHENMIIIAGQSSNGIPYILKKSGSGAQWVVDADALSQQTEEDQAKIELWWALRTRVLSRTEMADVRRYGYNLNTPSNQSYNGHEKAMEFNASLARQAELQMLAKTAALAPPPQI